MSQLLIQRYLNELTKLRQISGTNRESVVREAFKDLLKEWGRSQDLTFIPEYEIETKAKERRYVDGALLHTLRVPFGYWEAKDEKDDLDAEIELKFRRGYPKSNILFEDSTQAVLFQNGVEIIRCPVEDVVHLEKLLRLFFGYERPEIEAFRKAVEQFKIDLPDVLKSLRLMIDRSYAEAPTFRKAAAAFLQHAHDAINPNLVDADVREMLIQHILTGEVFSAVFPGTTYHEDNSVARELHKLEQTFFTGNTKHQQLKGLAPYYVAIRKAATEIETHHEKQTFLKSIYENFYKVYNPKAADRLGVVYTPNEIVRFMIHGADWLCEKHFGRNLVDKDVDILDPATGTGTFITELIEHFAGQPAKLTRKYKHELHANEVAILPYYVANLNIEATYAAATGTYLEFPGLCFVDTLDNTHALRKHRGHMDDLFGAVTDDNIRRIRQQNSRRISVIIGNPPYNANQLNENENNKNRTYPEVDKRIKETYIEASTAQKTKLYDMYARFFRWASDRLDENGVLAFITNRSFIDSRTFDGFRKVIVKEFSEVRIVDLGGDVRSNPKLSGTTHNVFGIQTGVAISFLVRRAKQKPCRIFYARRPEMEHAGEKLAFLSSTGLDKIAFEAIEPDKKGNWLNISDSDFGALLPLVSDRPRDKPIFQMRTNGVNTARDEWVYDFDPDNLLAKACYLVRTFNNEHAAVLSQDKFDRDSLTDSIKWSEGLINRVKKVSASTPTKKSLARVEYRPFVSVAYFADPIFSDRLTSLHAKIYGPQRNRSARCIAVSAPGLSRQFCVLATVRLVDWHFLGDTQIYPLTVCADRKSISNVSDSALKHFRSHYKSEKDVKSRPITPDAIFYYTYAVLHDPVYRDRYAVDLKREYPRVPLYRDFWRWADWGKELADLHTNYESASPFPLKLERSKSDGRRKKAQRSSALLRADQKGGRICLDDETCLTGVPEEAWEYRLGARSAIHWVLDQYKEYTPTSETIRERFHNYRFVDYRDHVIELLKRVTTISVSTVAVMAAMREADR